MSDKQDELLEGQEELLLEIVQLDNGDLALRRADQDKDEQPMLRVGVSDELRETMQEQYVDIARIMLTAGVQLMAEAGFVGDKGDSEAVKPTVH
mgnify:FL=1